jgi:hypothetical protein
MYATRHVAERLQCNMCKVLFTATDQDLERDGIDGRLLYSYSAAAVVCIHKYFAGLPWFRQEFVQQALGDTVPDSSMAELSERVADALAPVARYLRKPASDALTFLGDDTGALILEVRAATRVQRSTGKLVERTGCHVSCVIAITSEGHRIAIFRVGIQHTGELMDELLDGRDPQLPVPLFMGDCHACNTVTVCRVIYGGCNAHATRRFKALKTSYPEDAGYASQRYKEIFEHEAYCKRAGLDPQQRLAYHRQHSKPLFDAICEHGESLLENKKIEPNGDIAAAYTYVINNRVRLSAFLRHPGMPIDNNEPERILRVPVRLRDNAPFFRNGVGGAWAQTIWTVGETALLCGVNLLDYFQAVQRHQQDVKRNPHLWVPWAYRERLTALESLPSRTYRESSRKAPPDRQRNTAGIGFSSPGANTWPAMSASNHRRPATRAAGADLASS